LFLFVVFGLPVILFAEDMRPTKVCAKLNQIRLVAMNVSDSVY